MNSQISKVLTFVEYLIKVLGAEWEIDLYEVANTEVKRIAIRNGYISNNTIDSPIPNTVLQILRSKKLLPYYEIYSSLPYKETMVKECYYCITDDNRVIGLIGILKKVLLGTIDSSMNVCSKQLQKKDNLHADKSETKLLHDMDNGNNLEKSTIDLIRTKLPELFNNSAGNEFFSNSKRIELVNKLYDMGVFQVKGIIKEVADLLQISESTIYRYIRTIKQQRNNNENEDTLTYSM